MTFKVIDEEPETDTKDDEREKEKMLFNVIFTAEDGNIAEKSNVKRFDLKDDVKLKTKGKE